MRLEGTSGHVEILENQVVQLSSFFIAVCIQTNLFTKKTKWSSFAVDRLCETRNDE